MANIKVISLHIDEFRRFKNIVIPFGDRITIIAGQNGTSKSTLLGMLAQPFSFGIERGEHANTPDASSYIKNYHGLNLKEFADMSGKTFMYDCDNVFRLSEKHDFGKKYKYQTKLSFPDGLKAKLPQNRLTTKSRNRTKGSTITGMRFVTGPGASHESGEGNFPHPVIYLGLNRLWPLAVTKKCSFPRLSLSDEDRKWYVEQYKEVLCLEEENNGAQFMDTTEKKKFITPQGANYDGESCSAGQDNLGQILTALISFLRLKEKLGDKYMGGLLLIDELDATFHAFAQDKLLELLSEMSKELDLQIIATTHSLRVLEKAYHSPLKRDIEILYLAREDESIVLRNFSTYQQISDHLKVESTHTVAKRTRMVSVVFEDKEGEWLFNQICGSKLKKYIKLANAASLSAGKLKSIADMSKSLPVLDDIIFVPDGDQRNTWKTPKPNIVFLPGAERPETLIYKHLHGMKESDPFWKSIGPTYTRQVAITRESSISIETSNKKNLAKNWYKGQSPHWGRANEKVFKSWVRANKPDCLKFCKEFIKLLRQKYKGDIPKDIETKILAQFKDE